MSVLFGDRLKLLLPQLHSISRAAKVFYLWTSAVVEDRLSSEVTLG